MIIDQNGQRWFKGNLHTHTTITDGTRSPDDVIALYAAAGYDFLALTDHWHVSEADNRQGLLLLSGCEYDVGSNPRQGIFHIVGIGMEHKPDIMRNQLVSAQLFIDQITAAGGLPILAHPAWSLETPEQISGLRGLAAVEIYNSVSDLPHNARPYSGLLIDLLALSGMILPCVAADDSHFYDGEETKSFIMVRSPACTRKALLTAIRQGDFYATQGPQIDLKIKEDTAEVICSPAERIVFYSDAVWSGHRSFSGHGITSAVYALLNNEHFVRVEVTDDQGRTAWSSPISRVQS
ncbi:MAG: hypothetical protein VB070_00255 [Clostridiaceae bacterium]|nr:hypothetical protein [Clostridiaceae bacterium]